MSMTDELICRPLEFLYCFCTFEMQILSILKVDIARRLYITSIVFFDLYFLSCESRPFTFFLFPRLGAIQDLHVFEFFAFAKISPPNFFLCDFILFFTDFLVACGVFFLTLLRALAFFLLLLFFLSACGSSFSDFFCGSFFMDLRLFLRLERLRLLDLRVTFLLA